MTATGYEQFSDSGGPALDSELGRLATLASELHAADTHVAKLEEQLRQAREASQDLAERRIPELMDSLGMEEFRTKDGFRICVREKIRCSIAGERKDPALTWLEEHGHGGLIKRQLQVQFNRDQGKEAEQLKAELESRFGRRFRDEKKVESSTLAAWVRECLRDGVDIPMETFGVFRQRIAQID